MANTNTQKLNEYNAEICEKLPNTDEYASQRAAAGCGTTQQSLPNTASNIIKTTIGVVGLLAVVFIIVGAIQYITSSGDAGKAAKAKNTILYAVIGLVVALLSYAIVYFVVDKV